MKSELLTVTVTLPEGVALLAAARANSHQKAKLILRRARFKPAYNDPLSVADHAHKRGSEVGVMSKRFSIFFLLY